MYIPLFVPCKEIGNPGNVCLWHPESVIFFLQNQESWVLESGIPLTIGIWNSWCGIQNPRLSCIKIWILILIIMLYIIEWFIWYRTLFWLHQSSWTQLSCVKSVRESSLKQRVIKSSSRSIQFFLFSATFLKPHLYLVAHQLSMRSLSKEAVLKTYLGK